METLSERADKFCVARIRTTHASHRRRSVEFLGEDWIHIIPAGARAITLDSGPWVDSAAQPGSISFNPATTFPRYGDRMVVLRLALYSSSAGTLTLVPPIQARGLNKNKDDNPKGYWTEVDEE